jgi:hypothetical protein
MKRGPPFKFSLFVASTKLGLLLPRSTVLSQGRIVRKLECLVCNKVS